MESKSDLRDEIASIFRSMGFGAKTKEVFRDDEGWGHTVDVTVRDRKGHTIFIWVSSYDVAGKKEIEQVASMRKRLKEFYDKAFIITPNEMGREAKKICKEQNIPFLEGYNANLLKVGVKIGRNTWSEEEKNILSDAFDLLSNPLVKIPLTLEEKEENSEPGKIELISKFFDCNEDEAKATVRLLKFVDFFGKARPYGPLNLLQFEQILDDLKFLGRRFGVNFDKLKGRGILLSTRVTDTTEKIIIALREIKEGAIKRLAEELKENKIEKSDMIEIIRKIYNLDVTNAKKCYWMVKLLVEKNPREIKEKIEDLKPVIDLFNRDPEKIFKQLRTTTTSPRK